MLTLNEVTENFNTMLRSCEWVQSEYFISDFPHQQKDGSFNLIMTKIRPLCLRRIKVEGLARAVLTFYFNLGCKIATVSSVHLTSL